MSPFWNFAARQDSDANKNIDDFAFQKIFSVVKWPAGTPKRDVIHIVMMKSFFSKVNTIRTQQHAGLETHEEDGS